MESLTLPPLDVVGPFGERLTLRSLRSADTVMALSRRLGVDALAAGGRLLRPDERLVDVDELCVGAQLLGRTPDMSPPPDQPLIDVATVGGPDCSDWVSLGAGRHVIGRAATASVHVEDHRVEPHHVLLTVRPDGSVSLVQLTGAAPVRVNGEPLGAALTDVFDVPIAVGASELRIRAHVGATTRHRAEVGGSLARHPSDPWRRIVWRSPEQPSEQSTDQLTAPAPLDEIRRPPVTGLLGAAVMAGGAGLMAIITRNPMFAMFASVGVVATLVTFAVARVSARRRASAARAGHRAATALFEQSLLDLAARHRRSHVERHRSIVDTLHQALHGADQLWQRRCVHEVTATIGTGTVRWSPDIVFPTGGGIDPALIASIEACGRLDDVPSPLTLCSDDVVAFRGAPDDTAALARSVIVQLATWVGPADWQLVVVTANSQLWSWARWLPHGAGASGSIVSCDGVELADQLDAIDRTRLTVVVTDAPHLFAARTGPLRRFIAAGNVSAIALVDDASTVPAVCRRVLAVGGIGAASWVGRASNPDEAFDIRAVGVSTSTAEAMARRLASLVDPEAADTSAVPGALRLSELFGEGDLDVAAIVRRWRSGGADPSPCAPLGMSGDGRVDVDMVRDGPHGLLAGTTGAGKSELLRTLVVSLAASVSPEHVSFVLVDYKGGATFDACAELPHTVGVVTDLDDGLAERALVSLDAELEHRERLLRRVGAADLAAYRAHRSSPEPIARLVVVIDEFAALASELPDFLSSLVGIAQRGRSLGVHLLLATQRPAGVINDDIRANTNLRMALRLNDRADAHDVVGDELPATFSRSLPGRAALRLGPDELLVFQAARCTGPMPPAQEGIVVEQSDVGDEGYEASGPADEQRSELECAVEAIVEASSTFDRPRRPWVDPLEFPLASASLEAWSREAEGAVPIGAVDDPAHQCRRPLRWEPSDGNLALIGAVGSGTTSTLIAMAAALCASRSPGRLHLHVIDARGDDGLAGLEALAHCSGVVRVNEHERLHRVLSMVVDVIAHNMDSGRSGDAPAVVLMIDGYASLRQAISTPERHDTFELLQHVVNNAAAGGVALVVADDATSSAAAVPVAHRWIFHLDDPSAARSMGLRSAPVAPGRPGRLRIVESGCEAQVALGAAGLASIPTHAEGDGGPPRVRVLPERVTLHDVAAAEPVVTSSGTELPIGVGAGDLCSAALTVPLGEHVLIVGAARTGVSTALACVVTMWRAAHEEHRVVCVDRRTVLSEDLVASDAATLLVADDAHRIDDTGMLAAVMRGEHAHVTIIAGARADGVRSSYGHWTRELAKSRCGVVMSSRGDQDGDLLGVQIPRRPLVSARPGLGWIVDVHELRQVQVFADAE